MRRLFILIGLLFFPLAGCKDITPTNPENPISEKSDCSSGEIEGTAKCSTDDDIIVDSDDDEAFFDFSETVTLAGAGQKGPFVKESKVEVKAVIEGVITQYGFSTATFDNLGHYSLPDVPLGDYLVTIEGQTFNELSGQLLDGPLRLSGVVELNDTSASNYINVMTHIIHRRVLNLLMQGSTSIEATAQAQDELQIALSVFMPEESIPQFAHLSVYNLDDTDIDNNGYLLALSSLLTQYATNLSQANNTSVSAQLMVILNALSEDLADDGKIDSTEFIDEITLLAQQIDPDLVSDNLENYSVEAEGEEHEAADMSTIIAVLVVITSLLLSEDVEPLNPSL